MARYGNDYGRDRWSGGGGYGQGGFGGQQGGGMNRNRYGGEYGGMGSDAGQGGGSQAYGGFSGFGSGGGAYDNDFNAGYGGYGYSSGQNQGGQGRGGQGAGGYGADNGFSNYGGSEGGYGGGRDVRGGGGYGYGGGSSGGSGGFGYGSGGGAGYTGGGYGGGGQNYGGYGGGWTGGLTSGGDADRSYGGSNLAGGDELRRMRASDVMTDNPETVTPETSLADAARKMRDLDVGIIPVVESESSKRLRGVLTDRDIAIRAVAEGKDGNTTRVMEVMTTEVETCNKNDSLRDVLNVMEREQVRRVPITDREGRLVGIIAQADVATDVSTPQGQRVFADTVGEISEPGNPRGRGGWGGTSGGRTSQVRGSQGRGGQGGGGLMGAVRSAVSSLGGGSDASPRQGGGMSAGGSTQGNNDPRAMNDPGSENI
jgi:CBS domain-containing protein